MAGPITDPFAPVQFQPRITQSTGANGGVPVVNITAPNSAGISLNQYSQFNVDPIGLILNNSLVSGGSLTGGTVAANSNLSGRSASTIINQVTSAGAQYASVINGPIEVFGTPANVVIANPNGITATGVGFTNTPEITLTTGVPQFLTGVGGTPTAFATAAAVAYNVTSGNVQIEGPPGTNGPGAGIAGTVGEVDLIGQTVGIDAPVAGGQRVNVIAGNQLVSPQSVDTSGTTFAVAPNSAANTAAAINAPNQVAIDATQFGGITAGQISIISTAAGLGVRSDATLAATANNLTINSNGDVSVAGTFAQQSASVAGTGNVTLAGSNLATQYAVNAGGDILGTGAVSSGTDLTMTAGGSLSAGALQANGNVNLAAQGGDLSTAGIAAGNNLLITATGDISTTGTQVEQSATVASGGSATLSGSNLANSFAVSAGGDINALGTTSSATTLAMTAGGNLNAGTVQANGDVTLVAQTGSLSATAALTAANLMVTAGGNLNVATAQATGNLSLVAQGGDITSTTALSAAGLTMTAAGNLNAGTVQSTGNSNLLAQRGNLTSTSVLSGSDLTMTAGENLNTGTVQVAGNANLAAQGGNASTGAVTVGGNLIASAHGTLDTSAGQLNVAPGTNASAPALIVSGSATLTAANITTANATIGGAYSATATGALNTGGTASFQGSASLGAGNIINVGQQVATGNLDINAATVTNQTGATLASLQAMTVNSTDLTNTGTLFGASLDLTSTNSVTNGGSLLANTTLNLATARLNNTNGMIFAGDASQPTAPIGDVVVAATGGAGSFNNTNGQVVAQNTLTVNLPNQTFDPSVGVLDAGASLTLAVQTLGNSGTWIAPSTAVNVTATNGIGNSGTILQSAGTLTLNGSVTNTGSIIASDITINGALDNSANALINGGDAFTLNGSGTNAGTIQAVNNLNVTGASFNNTGGTTQAGGASATAGSGNLNFNLSGDLTNSGGTLSASNNLSIAANNINNSLASATATTTTTTTVVNAPLLWSTVIGTETVSSEGPEMGDGESVNGQPFTITTTTATLGDLLSPTGDMGDILSPSDDTTVSQPIASSGSVTFTSVPTFLGNNIHGFPESVNLWLLNPGSIPLSSDPSGNQTLALPTVTETTTSVTAATGGSVITAGNDVNITANSLNNVGGSVSAGHDASLNLQSFSNGGSAFTSSVTDTVDLASLNAFLSGLQSMQPTLSIQGSARQDGTGIIFPPTSFALSAPGTVIAPTTTSSIVVQGPVGQILAGNNLTLTGGNLTNAGTLSSGQDITINATSFTNQGINVGATNTVAGCGGGSTDPRCFVTPQDSGDGVNTTTQTHAFEQINSTISAGRDVVITANTVNNTFGTIAAGRDVVIGGTGTTTNNSDPNNVVASLTPAASVINTSGSITAGQDVLIQAANFANTTAPPALIHQDYGNTEAYAGCGGLYDSGFCEAYVDVQSADVGTISAGDDVSIQTGTFSNDGALISALNNVDITATTSAENSNQTLNAYWRGIVADYAYEKYSYGCPDAATCEALFGSSYGNVDNLDPPAPVGIISGTIQAGNSLDITSPTLTTSGNVDGTAIDLSGSQLVNGLTSSNVYTPDPTISQQVISLAPSTATAGRLGSLTTGGGANNGIDTVNAPTAPVVVSQTSGAGGDTSYLVSNATNLVIGEIGPNALLQNLPANLQPNNVPFYYDPSDEGSQIQQAALQATGTASFDSSVSYDSQSPVSIANQDKAYLYANTTQFAEQNNIPLGTALSPAQLQLVNAPMLWYVQQAVPEPGCIATGNAACPTVQTLMPEVLLPPNYAAVSADGEIAGQNVTLNYQGGSVTNTGAISAQNLTVNAATLTNEERSTDIGGIYSISAEGALMLTTGTEVQPGGFMSAVNYDLNVSAINQIGGALQQLNPDGTVNSAATQQLISSLQAQLGANFTQSTAQNNLHTSAVDSDSALVDGLFQVVTAAFAAAVSIIATPAAGAFLGNVMTQLNSDQPFSFSELAESVAVAELTADADQGLGLNNLSNPSLTLGQSLTLTNLTNTAETIVERSVVNAGIQTAIQGGSFATNLEDSAVSSLAAVVAADIGKASFEMPDSFNSLDSVVAHAILGCASSAALGSGCASGAVGGATSAALAPLLVDAAGGIDSLTVEDRAAITAAAVLLGGSAALTLGLNAQGAVEAAENEVTNNATGDENEGLQQTQNDEQKLKAQLQNVLGETTVTPIGTDEEGNPIVDVKPPGGAGGITGSGSDTDTGAAPTAAVDIVPLLPSPTPGSVMPNAMSPEEVAQANAIVANQGGTFIGQTISNTPGIDGTLDGVPVSLKTVTGNGMTAVQRNIVTGAFQMAKADQVGDMYIDATATGITTQNVTNWVQPGTPISNILNEGTVNNIMIETSNGWVKLTRSTLTNAGGQ